MKKSRIHRSSLIMLIAMILVISMSSISFASTTVKKTVYKGGGKVSVSFSSKTSYSKPKVLVIDNTGKSYSTKITSKKSTYITFKILSCRMGKTYRVTITGLKNGDAKVKFKIISKSTAISTAKKTAKKFGAKKFEGVSATSTTYRDMAVWKVQFSSNGYKYTYHISQQTGKIVRSEKK